jgi:hypothetical protein
MAHAAPNRFHIESFSAPALQFCIMFRARRLLRTRRALVTALGLAGRFRSASAHGFGSL